MYCCQNSCIAAKMRNFGWECLSSNGSTASRASIFRARPQRRDPRKLDFRPRRVMHIRSCGPLERVPVADATCSSGMTIAASNSSRDRLEPLSTFLALRASGLRDRG